MDPLEYISITDTSDLPYYDQILRGIKDAVAAGVLIPGDRLPPIRQLAERLELAPGTVARAYRELEAERIVLTAGASGTRIALPAGGMAGSREGRIRDLSEHLRPVVVSAFHLGADMDDLFEALRIAAMGVFLEGPPEG